jgi:hypothetical protein
LTEDPADLAALLVDPYDAANLPKRPIWLAILPAAMPSIPVKRPIEDLADPIAVEREPEIVPS